MTPRTQTTTFVLTEIDQFDARRGYTRCQPPGIGVSITGIRATPIADFWRSPQGKLVGKLSCAGERFWFEATHATGEDIGQQDLDNFLEFINNVLLRWLSEGIHEVDGIYDLV